MKERSVYRKFYNFRFADCQALAEYLGDMALKGWKLNRLGLCLTFQEWRGALTYGRRSNYCIKKEGAGIKLLCAVPYAGFESRWSPEWRQLYREILASSDYTKVFFPCFTYDAFRVRNRWTVDHSARVIAVYNGAYGGTRHTIAYAKKQQVRVCVTAG